MEPETRNQNPESILVLKPSSLGDIVHTLPAVALVRKRWPDAQLRWLVNTEWMPLLEENPTVNEVVEFPRKNFRGAAGLLRIAPWAGELRDRVRADLILDFQGLLRSALIAKLCRAEGARVFGLSDAREGARHFYDQVMDVSGHQHAVDRYLALVAVLGIDIAPPLEWPLPVGAAPAGFDRTEPYVVLHPFSRGEGKSLTAGQVAEFCRAMAPRRVVLAGRTDLAISPTANTVDLLNRTTLTELIWLLRHAAFTVSVDSGPMHIAAALGPRLLSLHTWSDPAKVGPYQPEAWVWKDLALFQMRDLANAGARRPADGMTELAAFVGSQL